MASYKEKILEVIGDAEVGLTTVDVAKKAGVSKTTVIKYLSVLSSEGRVEFVEVGPSKLWRNKGAGIKHAEQTLNVTGTLCVKMKLRLSCLLCLQMVIQMAVGVMRITQIHCL